jgi:hypothetical protein
MLDSPQKQSQMQFRLRGSCSVKGEAGEPGKWQAENGGRGRARTGDPLLAKQGEFNLSRYFGCACNFYDLVRPLQMLQAFGEFFFQICKLEYHHAGSKTVYNRALQTLLAFAIIPCLLSAQSGTNDKAPKVATALVQASRCGDV